MQQDIDKECNSIQFVPSPSSQLLKHWSTQLQSKSNNNKNSNYNKNSYRVRFKVQRMFFFASIMFFLCVFKLCRERCSKNFFKNYKSELYFDLHARLGISGRESLGRSSRRWERMKFDGIEPCPYIQTDTSVWDGLTTRRTGINVASGSTSKCVSDVRR